MSELYDETFASSYDAEYEIARTLSGDRAFYEGLAAETGGPILELGCGTGRVLLAIARSGLPCVGLDLSRPMLDILRRKDPPPNLRLVEASMTDFDLGDARFRLIFSAFRPFQHLCTVDEQMATLQRVRHHLAPGGLLAFDVFGPLRTRLGAIEDVERADVEVPLGPLTLRRYVTLEHNPVEQVVRGRYRHEHWCGNEKVGEQRTEVRMRWFFRYEMESLLLRAGFEVVALYGRFDKQPYQSHEDMIFVARATR